MTETYVYGFNKYPYNLIGPAAIIWHADIPEPNMPQAPAVTRGTKARGKGKGKEKATSADNPQQRTRIVWIRVHPSITDKVHEALRVSTSFALEAVKQAGRITEVEIADLREHFNVFEIMGPKSSQVIKGALKPVLEDKREEFKKVAVILYCQTLLTDDHHQVLECTG